MSEERKSKVYLEDKYFVPEDYKPQLRLGFFISGCVLAIIYAVFSAVVLTSNAEYIENFKDGVNIFRLLSYVLSGSLGFYFIICWLMSILMVYLFMKSTSSDIVVIGMIAKMLVLFSFISFVLPIIFIILII